MNNSARQKLLAFKKVLESRQKALPAPKPRPKVAAKRKSQPLPCIRCGSATLGSYCERCQERHEVSKMMANIFHVCRVKSRFTKRKTRLPKGDRERKEEKLRPLAKARQRLYKEFLETRKGLY